MLRSLVAVCESVVGCFRKCVGLYYEVWCPVLRSVVGCAMKCGGCARKCSMLC